MKSAHTMALMSRGKILKVYKVALGRSSGAKRRKGDHKTPVAMYVVDAEKSESRFDAALHVSYPNSEDRARAARLGQDPGGDIEIHGVEPRFAWLGSAQHWIDWTDGCIAVTDSQIEKIWPVVRVGTVIEIRP
ncbi:MAG TPA: L,D-transpeptidase family protein [Candidatus Dormibacteraeota bacterium]|nr:L,D-transpeptidase family protein [Candidatus Dormibacteraeota bacterium]